MPILKGSATFSRYRIEHEAKGGKRARKGLEDLAAALKLRAFAPLDREGEEERAQGFVEFHDKGQAGFTPGALYEGPYALFAFRIDEIRIPAAAVRAELEAWAQRFEAENKRRPGKQEKSDAKGEIKHTLKSRYPISTKSFEISINLETEHVQLWAGSRKAVDELQAALEQALGVRLVPIAPLTVAADLGIIEKSLTPTAQLSGGVEISAGESHAEA